jgi:outer membrane cobalamin receptor
MRDTVTVLPPVHVDDRRRGTSSRETAPAVRLDRAGTQRFLPASVGDALVTVPGVDLVKTGPWASRLSMRGVSGDRVLLMVDGVRLNSVRGHGVQPSLIPLDRLDGVELLPGASSAEFGSDALGGVVNLITHRTLFADSPQTSVSLTARAAEPGGSRAQHLRARMSTRHWGLDVSGGLGRLRALSTPDGDLPNSGDHEEDLTARTAVRWRGATLDYEHSHHAAYDIGLPAFGTTGASSGVYPLQGRDAERVELNVPGAGWRPEMRWLGVSQLFRSEFTETTVDTTFRFGQPWATTRRVAADEVGTRVVSLQPELRFAGFGRPRVFAEVKRERAYGPRETDQTFALLSGAGTPTRSSTYGESMPRAERTAWAAGLAASHAIASLKLEGGVRYDALRSSADSTAISSTAELDVTDRRWSADAGVARAFARIEPFARVASGFRAPNLEERYFNGYFHGGLRLFGNPDLRAERSLSLETGVRAREGMLPWIHDARLSVFRMDVDDLVTFEYLDMLYGVPRFQYVNVDRARIEGIEAMAQTRVGPFNLGLAGGLPRAIDRETGERLVDAGAPRASIDLSSRIDRWVPYGTIAARWRWSDAVRTDDATIARPAFSTVSLEMSSVVAGVRGVLAVRNLFDHAYREPLSFIPEPGRTFAFSIRRDFNLPIQVGF